MRGFMYQLFVYYDLKLECDMSHLQTCKKKAYKKKLHVKEGDKVVAILTHQLLYKTNKEESDTHFGCQHI